VGGAVSLDHSSHIKRQRCRDETRRAFVVHIQSLPGRDTQLDWLDRESKGHLLVGSDVEIICRSNAEPPIEGLALGDTTRRYVVADPWLSGATTRVAGFGQLLDDLHFGLARRSEADTIDRHRLGRLDRPYGPEHRNSHRLDLAEAGHLRTVSELDALAPATTSNEADDESQGGKTTLHVMGPVQTSGAFECGCVLPHIQWFRDCARVLITNETLVKYPDCIEMPTPNADSPTDHPPAFSLPLPMFSFLPTLIVVVVW
jgi:hypothetical protein